jgi:energy-converting hydrogenase Eha subunit A
MTGLLASVRPDSWNLPLFIHVLGAMVLVGAVTAAVVAQLWTVAVADGDRLRRFSFRTLLFVAIPSWFVMAAGAEWIYSKEFGDTDDDPTWIGIGFITREVGGLLLLISVICAGIASRKSKSGLARASGIIAAIALAAWVVAIWAMSAKPG